MLVLFTEIRDLFLNKQIKLRQFSGEQENVLAMEGLRDKMRTEERGQEVGERVNM